MISAKCVAASQCGGQTIYTLQLRYPRIVHGEFMTHRMFSRNASSSRAIPVEKQIQDVLDNPYIPEFWGRNQPGMQAQQEEIENIDESKESWYRCLRRVTQECRLLNKLGVHKQWANRWLEPVSHIDVVVTATEWKNFFNLRCHKDAQPEIRELAEVIKDEIEGTFPKPLFPGEWHLPYILEEEKAQYDVDALRMASVARCARVSYRNHDKSVCSVDSDVELATKLLEAGHMSPFEHQATPMKYNNNRDFGNGFNGRVFTEGVTHLDCNRNMWSGNFKGFLQHRQLL